MVSVGQEFRLGTRRKTRFCPMTSVPSAGRSRIWGLESSDVSLTRVSEDWCWYQPECQLMACSGGLASPQHGGWVPRMSILTEREQERKKGPGGSHIAFVTLLWTSPGTASTACHWPVQSQALIPRFKGRKNRPHFGKKVSHMVRAHEQDPWVWLSLENTISHTYIIP